MRSWMSLFFILLLVAGCASVETKDQSAVRPLTVTAVVTTTHTVQKGETLWRISKMYYIDLEDIVAANRISDSSVLLTGQALFIPATHPRGTQTPTPVLMPASDFAWPIHGKILVYFKEKNHGVLNKGLDISAISSQDVCAARPGRIVFIGDLTGYGTTIVIDHGDGFSSIYGGVTSVLVKTGEDVEQKKIIAKTGRPPRNEFGALHFQIRKNHKPQNPLFYLGD